MKSTPTPYDAEIAECGKHGSDAEFQAFVRSMVSAISHEQPCEYCHVRRSYNSGVGMKPPFSGVPLTRDEHALQHSKGERDCLNNYQQRIYHTVDSAKQWFDLKAAHYRKLWIEFKTGETA